MSRRLPAAISVALVLATTAGVGAWWTIRSVRATEAQLVADLTRGAQELEAGKRQLAAAAPANLAPLDAATAQFDASRRDFAAAQAHARDSRTLAVLGAVPLAGGLAVAPRLRSALGVAEMGSHLADAGLGTVAVDAQLLAPAQAGLSGGQRLVAFLASSGPGLAAVRGHLAKARDAARSVDPGVLPAGQRQLFQRTAADIEAALTGLDEFARVAAPIAQVLGAGGRRTYLLEQVDPAELRGAGGFIGSYSLLDVDHGRLTLGEARDVFLIDSPYPEPGQQNYVAAPAPVQQAIPHGWVFGDSNHSPDFATAAQAGERLFANEAHRSVDGVVSIDPWAVAALLSVTGPLAIPQYGTTVRAQTFPEDVFQRLETATGNTPTRKDFFPAVAALVLERINALPSSQWSQLLTALNQAVTQRHLQVYLDDPAGEAVMAEVGWAGAAIGPSAGADEALMEVESNFGGTKANHFLTRRLTLDLTVNGDRLDQVLRVEWQNDTPAGYLGDTRDYTAYARVYLPRAATAAHATDLTPDANPLDERPDGAVLVDGWASVHTGARLAWSVAWSTPLTSPDRRYAIYWRKQAGTLDDAVHVVLHVDGRTLSADTDLGQDRTIVLTPLGIQLRSGTGGAATLPFLHP
ncbi:MAG TPA: DUF4012 domain-containing protein [Candidatus Dormibacteraeota bacterium]|nr:DUF4012 domain-containing protein [Candidatus Dormibacteraeota bacterium]